MSKCIVILADFKISLEKIIKGENMVEKTAEEKLDLVKKKFDESIIMEEVDTESLKKLS